MYKYELSEQLDKKLAKLFKKNKAQVEILDKQIKKILKNPHRFKNLTGDLKGIKRVHIDKHFVLIFEVFEQSLIIRFLDYDHHDNIY